MLRPKNALVTCVLCAAALGCSKKVPECNALVKQLNESSTAMQSKTTALVTNPKQARESLDTLVATTKAETDKLAKVELTVPELQGFSKNYQLLLSDMTAAAQAIGKASIELENTQSALTKSQTGWVSAQSKLNGACQKARRECTALGDKIMKFPTISGIKPEEDAKKLDDYAKSIGSVDVKHPEMKAAVDELKKHLGEFAAALRKSVASLQDVEKANKAMTDASAKEPPLVKSINDFCQAG